MQSALHTPSDGAPGGIAIAQPNRVPVRIPVAIVLTSFDPGGTERQMTELISRLDQHRFELHVVCFRREGRWLPRVEAATRSITAFPLTTFRAPSAWRQVIRFAGWCRSRRIAVVHACDFYANIFALTGAALARVPQRIGSRRDILIPQRSTGQHRLQSLSYRFAHHVVANSRAAAEQAIHEGVSRNAITVIPNGIDVHTYPPPRVRSQRHIVTTVANLRAEKGHDVLLRAAARITREVPDAMFQLVGDGPMHDALAAQAASLGIAHAVRFLGHREDVPNVLHESDLFVLPSRTEAFPNGVLEAMAAGLPVVATRVGGIPELVTDGEDGVLVPAADENALAAAILALMREPDRALRLGSAARATIEARYSFDEMVHAFEALYADELSNTLPTDTASRPWAKVFPRV